VLARVTSRIECGSRYAIARLVEATTVTCDVIVVGSGASAVHAAYPLVQSGRTVIMLDVGHQDTSYAGLIPRSSYTEIRRTDPQQHRYFLGEQLEGVPLTKLGAGPQIVPPRQFVLKDGDRLAPKATDGFAALESFAVGGLGAAWGAVAFPFLDRELEKCGLPAAELHEHYEIVARRIGISGRPDDDLVPLRGAVTALQPPLDLDHNGRQILSRYEQKRHVFRKGRVSMGQSLLAALSRPLPGREPNAYSDMDYWVNHGDSVYRPDVTLRELESYRNFQYRRPVLVNRFSELDAGGVQVEALSIGSGVCEVFTGRALILAAGALGTTRIVLRSLEKYDHPVPFACNPHMYIPSVNYRGLGTPHSSRAHSLAQLTMIYEPEHGDDHAQMQMYSYRSLLLFRLLKEAPLSYREALRIFRTLAPSFAIWVVQHPDHVGPGKSCVLRRGAIFTDDTLQIAYRYSEDDIHRQRQAERVFVRHIRKLGCWPIRRVHPGDGSSIHYGGQFPMSGEPRPLTTELTGRLRGTSSVFLADGSTFAYLPAKGPTFTLMANANRIGGHVLRMLSGTQAVLISSNGTARTAPVPARGPVRNDSE
jgi:hypothetical protein